LVLGRRSDLFDETAAAFGAVDGVFSVYAGADEAVASVTPEGRRRGIRSGHRKIKIT
jgi:hypothetical protein